MAGLEVAVQIDQARLKTDMDLLSTFAPKLRRKLIMQLRLAAQGVADASSGRMAALKVTTRDDPPAEQSYKVRVRGPLVQIRQLSRGGQITEMAGRKNPQGLTKQGMHLIETLDARYGKPGRVMWRQWDHAAPGVLAEVARLVITAEAELNAALGLNLAEDLR